MVYGTNNQPILNSFLLILEVCHVFLLYVFLKDVCLSFDIILDFFNKKFVKMCML
jgi:hypothetical protein